MSQYVVIVTDETGASSCFGPFRSYAKAREVHTQLLDASSRYTHGGEAGDMEVQLETCGPWPGLARWLEEVS